MQDVIEPDFSGHEPDNDELAAALVQYHERQQEKAIMWGNISRWSILAYVFVGGGYEIVTGLLHHHIQASFVFSIMSALIFIGRIKYATYSGAIKTVWADICGATVMLALSVLHVVINGSFL